MHTTNGQTAPKSKTRSSASANIEELSTNRQLLKAVMRRNDELLEYQSLLSGKVRTLEAALAKAHRFSHYDELTGLPNRRLLLDRFLQASPLATRHRQLLALLFFDLDEFKSVNDRLGHEAGDKLLQQVAQRLSSVIRKSDTVCRYGGDEFVVLITEIDNREQAVNKQHAIRAHFVPSFTVDGHSIRLTASVGLAIYPTDAEDFNELLRYSDRSMFSNKAAARNRLGSKPELDIARCQPGAVTNES
jgi:diguanylate cyclase (GGDEF)-like protein